MFHLFCSRLEGIVEVTMVHFSFILELCVCVFLSASCLFYSKKDVLSINFGYMWKWSRSYILSSLELL